MPKGPKKHSWIKSPKENFTSYSGEEWLYYHKEFAVCRDCGAVKWMQEDPGSRRDATFHTVLYVRKGSKKVEHRAPPCNPYAGPLEIDVPETEVTTRFERLFRDDELPPSAELTTDTDETMLKTIGMIQVKKPEDVPKEPHYAVLIYKTEPVHIPGDERSRTAPGHGYPAHTETYDSFEHWATPDASRLQEFVEDLEKEQAKQAYSSRKPYVVLRVARCEVKVTTRVEIPQ